MAQGIGFEQVRAAELRTIGADKEHHLLGLALSGGGIRSATFNLGVLQGLARHGLLTRFDYLSTVSGGGYIGSWLSAWTAREAEGIEGVQKKLADERREPDEVKFLREYSNYLTPRLGWMSIDTLTGAATYARNMLLNLAIIVAVVATLLLAPWLLGWAGKKIAADAFLWASFVLLGIAALSITLNVIWQEVQEYGRDAGPGASPGGEVRPFYVRSWWIIWMIVAPLLLWAGALALAVARNPEIFTDVAIGTGVVTITAALVIIRSSLRQYALRSRADAKWCDLTRRRVLGMTLGRFFGIALGALAGLLLAKVFAGLLPKVGATWHAVVWGVPVMLAIFMLAVTIMLGLTGRDESEYGREWWSRLGGLLIRAALVWFALAAAAVYGPWLVLRLGEWASGLSAAWVIATAGSVLAARSAATGKDEPGKWLELVCKIGPYVFMLGLLLAVATVSYLAIARLQQTDPFASSYFSVLGQIAGSKWMFCALGFLVAAFLLLSGTVDINLFSFHMFYRNRLTRCYLGASTPRRDPLPFIGFDPRDNPKLGELRTRPYHLVNAALNLTSSQRLGWQERKAGSFVMSPLYCGYQFSLGPSATQSIPSFQETAAYASRTGGNLNLGTALTISGAAANPNMGYHSSPSVAFLLAVFNLRLGWWMQNPRNAGDWKSGGPYFGLYYLMCELLGLSSDRTRFVSLSDGGHFDNLGIYELVRRRCRFIVVCDASADRKFTFEDLGNAIRKCRIDLEVDIEIDKSAIAPDPVSGRARHHCAVGTIHYEKKDPSLAPGYLLYIKSSLSGNEPSDVLQYAATNPDFPHESTADQWFSESQFESYRKLGLHVAHTVFEEAGVKPALDTESVFVAVKERWFPPARAGSAVFSKHGAELKRLEEILRSDPHLKFLDQQLYPEWETLARGASPVPPRNLWLPQGYDELRAGFHFCSSLLQLMESVYGELNLEEDQDHPDHRGWMNLFRHWSWSGMFIVTYAVCCSMLGARFQRFCERRLDLRPGRLHVGPPVARLSETASQLNFFEVEIIRRLEKAPLAFSKIFLLQTVVWSPEVLQRHPPGAPGSQVYTFGFALAQDDTLVYFRIQNHVRQMGFARRALSRLLQKHGLKTCDVTRAGSLTKDQIEWLEPQDFSGLARLFESVKLQPGDVDELREAALMKARAGAPPR